MVDIAGVISEAFALYKEKWKEVIVPFVVLFVISIIFAVLDSGLSVVSDALCDAAGNPYLLLVLCYAPEIMRYALGLIEGLVSLVVIMAVLRPLWELVEGVKVSEWTVHLGNQFVNAVKVILLRFALTVVAFLPLGVFIVLNIAAIVAAVKLAQGLAGILLLGGLAVMLALGLLTVILLIIINFLLTFLEIEMVVGGKGLLSALQASYGMVASNLVGVFLFNLVWWLIGIALGLITLALCCTLCLAPLALAIRPFIVTPVEWTSRLTLWRELGGGKNR